MAEEGHRILIIADPNGAGKTTFAREYLLQEANCPVFINADLIAAGLSPFRPGSLPGRPPDAFRNCSLCCCWDQFRF